MKFLCEESCIDSGTRDRLNRLGTPVTHNYKMDVVYEFDGSPGMDEAQLLHLTEIGLFPEFFSFADDLARIWVDQNNDKLCDIVEDRKLPYRKLTATEIKNDEDIRLGRKEGEYTLPHGPIAVTKVKLVRRSPRQIVLERKEERVPGQRTLAGQDASQDAPPPAPIASVKVRKPMTAADRKAMGERLRKGRERKRAAAGKG